MDRRSYRDWRSAPRSGRVLPGIRVSTKPDGDGPHCGSEASDVAAPQEAAGHPGSPGVPPPSAADGSVAPGCEAPERSGGVVDADAVPADAGTRVVWSKWEGVAASVCGSKHVARQQPCQDASSVLILPNASFLVVADGAGSALHGGEGSQLAVETIERHLAQTRQSAPPRTGDGWSELLRGTFTAAREALEARAASSSGSRQLGSLATTLLVLGADDLHVVAASIGDCAGIHQGPHGELVLTSPPESGEYVNEAAFLTDPDWQARLRVVSVAETVQMAAAFSDGLQFVALHHGQPFPGFVDGLVTQLRGLDSAGRQPALVSYLQNHVAGKRTDDDITFAAMWRREVP